MSPAQQKNLLKIWLLALPGGALTTFPCKLHPQLFFSALGVYVWRQHLKSSIGYELTVEGSERSVTRWGRGGRNSWGSADLSPERFIKTACTYIHILHISRPKSKLFYPIENDLIYRIHRKKKTRLSAKSGRTKNRLYPQGRKMIGQLPYL